MSEQQTKLRRVTKNLASAVWDLAVSAGSLGAQGLVLCVALASAWEAHKTDDPDDLTHCILWLVLAQLMRAR